MDEKIAAIQHELSLTINNANETEKLLTQAIDNDYPQGQISYLQKSWHRNYGIWLGLECALNILQADNKNPQQPTEGG